MGTASVTTRGTRNDRLESTSSAFSYLLLQQARTFSSNQESILIEKLSSLPIIEITSPTWNPADLRMSGPRSAPTRPVDYISTARRDIWSHTTAPLTAISPVLDLRCISSLLANAVLVHGALTGTRADALYKCSVHERTTLECHL
jgi:hypothetical protein